MKKFLFLSSYLLVANAWAGAAAYAVGGSAGGTLYPGSLSDVGSSYRTIAANTNVSGSTLLSDKVRTAIGAANADMYVQRAISLRGALALGARALPYVGAAAIGYDIYTHYRCSVTGEGLKCLGPEGAPAGVGGYGTYTREMGSAPYGGYSTMDGWASANKGTLDGECAQRFGSGTLASSWSQSGDRQMTVNCGTAPEANPFADVGDSPLTPDQVADKLAPYADPSIGPDLVRGALSKGIDATPYATPVAATGPASVSQPVSTTTKTDASGVQSVSTQQVTNNITYSGDTYHITNTTTINNPDGSTETTTEEPQQTQCEKTPSIVGCAELGDPGTNTPSWQTKDVVYSADSLGLPAACPAPWVGSVHGWNLSFSYAPVCDNAAAIRAGVLAMAGLTALFLIITTVKS